MNPLTKSHINTIFEKMQEPILYLFGRWQEEREYEDWADYEQKMREEFAKVSSHVAALIIKCTKRPFGLTFIIDGWEIVFKATASEYRWAGRRAKATAQEI